MEDYRNTLCLPKTSFPMKANLPSREPKIQCFWEEIHLYKLLREWRREASKYVLHDGPPYANGDIHMGHALNKILKDIIVKYKIIAGFDSPFIPGWDCHGLPIEHEVMKRKFKGKSPSKAEIRKECEAYAKHFVKVQRKEFKRLGIIGDWDNSYLTLNPTYCAKVIEVFGHLVSKGYVYKSQKPIYWCANCKTALAEAEVEYLERCSPSIYVKFPLRTSSSFLPNFTSLLVWTTTPWTLPANVAISIHPRYKYAVVEVDEEALVLATQLVEQVMRGVGIKEYKIIKTINGKDLEGLRCTHPFVDRDSLVILGEHVRADQGTGCVHTAPGHGVEDYEIGVRYNLPVLTPVDDEGRFTSLAGEFAGLDVFRANDSIIKKLAESGYLLYCEEITHSYPHCWRCKKALLFRATEQWFISLKELQRESSRIIGDVEWIPKWGEERLREMILQRTDWCISRQRVWGVPIVAFYCEACNHLILNSEIIKGIADLIRKEGLEGWYKREASALLPSGMTCPNCSSASFRKEEDILDVWFESGVSHQAVLREMQELGFPAALYLEGSDQYRGWFQSSLLTAVALEGKSPYKSVLSHGFMLDAEGRAMHKSRGNAISPLDVVERYGADVLRLWVASADYRGDVRLGDEILKRMVESYRKVRNTCRFILGNLYDFNPEEMIPYNNLLPIDKWILHRLQLFIKNTKAAYEEFEFYRIYHYLNEFTSVDLSSTYLDILKDRLYTHHPNSKERRAAQSVLYQILKAMVVIMAPILSHTAEEVWQYLREDKRSVFLNDFPNPKDEFINQSLAKELDRILKIREKVLSSLEKARREDLIGNSLEAKINLKVPKEEMNILSKYTPHLPSIFIVSQVNVEQKDEVEIEVERADGEKCARCWNYSVEVGCDSNYPTLCGRCIEVIKKLNERRDRDGGERIGEIQAKVTNFKEKFD